MSQDYVITGVSRGSREKRTLRVRAADERAAGWAAIERGLDVISIEPVGGPPPSPAPFATAVRVGTDEAKPCLPFLSRMPAAALLGVLVLGVVLAAVAGGPLRRDLREFNRVNDFYRRYDAGVARMRGASVPGYIESQLAGLRRTRNVFFTPVVLECLIVLPGVVCAGACSYELLRRLCRNPGDVET